MIDEEAANDNVNDWHVAHMANIDLYVQLIRKLGWVESVDKARQLDKFLGIDTYTLYSTKDDIRYFMLDDLTIHRIEAFLGPYGDALLKAYAVKKGLGDVG